jgi:hypothetical protein
MATFAEQAKDVREVARSKGIRMSNRQVALAVDAHRGGKGYLDAIYHATKRGTTRTGPATKMGSV